MRKFRFQFEAVLKVRKSKEQDALSALGAAQRAYQYEVACKQDLQRTLAQSLERREQLGSDEATPALSFRIEQAFIDGTKQRIIKSEQAILRASRNVERALRGYLMARRQTRMMESLEERAYAEYKRERAKKEQREMDDLTVMRSRFGGILGALQGQEEAQQA